MKGAAPSPRRSARQTLGVVAQARVHLWGELVGTVTEYTNGRVGFAYDAHYAASGLAISPRFLPLTASRTFEFPELRGSDTFLGLPGALADSLPDTFGNLVIRSYFQARGEPAHALSPIQRLLYVGDRAMGALEYKPHLQRHTVAEERALEVKALVESARRLVEGDTSDSVREILRVGGSAGGARAKALILWDRQNARVRSGFARPAEGEEPWLVKFDGVGSANGLDHGARPFNRIEYTYALLAKQLGIDMEDVHFIEGESGQFHFMTRRFDRTGDQRHHLHSLGGITHVDFSHPQAYSYEAWFRLILELRLGHTAIEQAFRRMLFNVVGRNQDDHVKNISFLMKSRDSGWSLAPAYDLTYAAGTGYTRAHQMTATGRADDHTRSELVELGKRFDVRHPERLLDQTVAAFADWPRLARTWGVATTNIAVVTVNLRLYLSAT